MAKITDTVAWSATKVTGTEGGKIALASITGSFKTLAISGVPVGATLSDGAGHAFTATAGLTSVDVTGWSLATLGITTISDANFTLTARTGGGASATEGVTVNPLAPTVAWVGSVSGTEGGPIALGSLGITVGQLAADGTGNVIKSVVISNIPIGVTLSDGAGHSITATNKTKSVDVTAWSLSTLRVSSANDTNFTLTVTATEADKEGNTSVTTATETVVINPLVPTVAWAAAPSAGVEGSAIALGGISVTVNKLAGDGSGNTLQSLVVSAVPVGTTLSDGAGHSFTATAGTSSVDVKAWSLSTLKVTPAGAANFTLTVTATERDAEGNTSTATASEAVVVNPLAPVLGTAPVAGHAGEAIALNISATAGGLGGEANTISALVISGVPVGAVLGDGAGHSFTATAAVTSVDVAGWSLASLHITPVAAGDFTLSVTATERDVDGNTATATASEAVSVTAPVDHAPTVTADGPAPVLVEADGTPGAIDTASVHLTKGDVDTAAQYDTTGWIDNHDGTFSMAGTYGTAILDTAADTLTYHLDNNAAATNALSAGQAATETFTINVTETGGPLTAATAVSFAITGSNDAPVVQPGHVTLADTPAPDALAPVSGTLAATDPEGDIVTFALDPAGNGIGAYGTFGIDAAGHWTYTPDSWAVDSLADGQTATDSFGVLADDGNGGVTAQTVTVDITGANDAPAFSMSTNANVANHTTLVADLSAYDVDGPNPVTYSITGGANAANFGIVNNQLVFTTAPDYATDPHSYAVEITATDGVSSTVQAMTVGVLPDMNTAPFSVIDPAQAQQQAAGIINAVIGSTPGITADTTSLQMVAGTSSVMYYDGSLTSLGIGAGLLITSGTVPGTINTVGYYGVDNNMPGDPALDAVVNTVFQTTSFDATTITFSFTVTDPTITGLSLDVLFASDEFPEYVDAFVDIGVVLVNGVNVAYFGNNPMAPLSVVSGNLAANYFIDNTGNLTTSSYGGVAVPGVPGTLPIEYDGVSRPLTIYAPVHLGVNTIQIGIADTGDHILDSGLFISNLHGTTIPATGVVLDVPCTDGADDKTGTDANEAFNAMGGDDIINATGGDDVVQGGAGNDTEHGDAGNDFLDGGTGTNTLAGDDGDDTIQHTGTGVDYIDGGTGSDTLLLNLATSHAGETIDMSDTAAVHVLTDGTTFTNMDVLSFHGGDGVDMVTGGAGNDILDGGAGNDVLAGGAGNDQIIGGAGVDMAVFSGNAADYVVTTLGVDLYQIIGADGTDTLSGIETLQFADGAVSLTGQVSSGVTITGTGNDDFIDATQTVAGQPLPTDSGDIIHGYGGDDHITGGNGADQIFGDSGNDFLNGGGGNDIITGGAGNDEMRGNAGADTFVFTAPTDSTVATHDDILDFSTAEGDKIDLSGIDAIQGGADDAFAYVTAFSGTAGELIAVHAGDGYLVQGDTNGDGLADFAIQVDTHAALAKTDFIL